MFVVGDYVKVYFKSGLVEAGQLIETNETNWVVECIDKSILTIIAPLDNVAAVRVFKPEQDEEKTESSTKAGGVFVDEELKPTKYHRKEDLRAMELAELHKLKAHEERKRARELLRDHRPTALPEVTFGIPDFSKSVSQHPQKKARRST